MITEERLAECEPFSCNNEDLIAFASPTDIIDILEIEPQKLANEK